MFDEQLFSSHFTGRFCILAGEEKLTKMWFDVWVENEMTSKDQSSYLNMNDGSRRGVQFAAVATIRTIADIKGSEWRREGIHWGPKLHLFWSKR